MLFATQISKLTADLAAATAANEQLTNQVSTLTAANEKCEQQYNADQETIRTLTSARDTLQGQVTDLTGKLEKAGKEVEDKVIEGISAAGVPAIKRDPAAVDTTTGAQAERVSGSARSRLAATINSQINKK